MISDLQNFPSQFGIRFRKLEVSISVPVLGLKRPKNLKQSLFGRVQGPDNDLHKGCIPLDMYGRAKASSKPYMNF